MQRRCFWPPDRFLLFSSIKVFVPSFSFDTNSALCETLSAKSMSLSSAERSPISRLSFIVPEKRLLFCGTTCMTCLKYPNLQSRTSWPNTLTLPFLTSLKRGIRFTSVLLPAPVPPIIPIVSPFSAVKLMFDRAFSSDFGNA